MSDVSIKMLSVYASSFRSVLPGEIAEFSREEAAVLVQGGYAEYVDEEVADMPEEVAERAVLPRRRKR